MQIPILNGTFTDEDSDFRTSYPRNMIPVPKVQGISNGYLRPSDGMIALGPGGPGTDRAGINWDCECFRVMGTKLVSIARDGAVAILGDVGGSGQSTLDYSFDRLGISSNGKLFYWDRSTLVEVTDPDLGTVIDFIWIDGFFLTTDGEFITQTELNDPTSVRPFKYASSEVDPDPIKALLKVDNEAIALNRYTIESFDDIGGSGFSFQVIPGAQITKGTIGTYSCAVYKDAIAFLGGGRGSRGSGEPPAVWLGLNGTVAKISTREVDTVIQTFTEEQLADVVFEVHVDKSHNQLHIRLPDRTLVYDDTATQAVGENVWFDLTSGIDLDSHSRNRASNRVWVYDKWIVGDPESSAIGFLSNSDQEHWGEEIGWEFSTGILYNKGNSAIVHDLELVSITGRSKLGKDPTVSTQYSIDGETWSNPRFKKAGKQGDRTKRIAWRHQGRLRNWRVQRFRGTSDSRLSPARLEARLEPLAF